MFIPGASELEKLVPPAEAWAQEACRVLKINVRDKIKIAVLWDTSLAQQKYLAGTPPYVVMAKNGERRDEE